MKKLDEECGLFGIYDHEEASRLSYLGLYALQHRGQESAGIVSTDGDELHSVKDMGYVGDVFTEEKLDKLPGRSAIGHVRYSTAGESKLANAQPILISSYRGQIALGHNGNLVNAAHLRKKLEKEGSIFLSSNDSEVILHLIARSDQKTFEDALVDSLRTIKGAYSLVFATKDSIIGVRDPRGFRPLVLGKVNGSYVLASETSALDLIDAEFIREVDPGEIIIIDEDGTRSIYPFEEQDHKQCIFELVYFARPDSFIFGQNVNDARNEMGRILAREKPVDADLVVPIPDSGVCAAIGYSQESGIPFNMALIRNHYIGRTFIEPTQSVRNLEVKIKLNPVKSILKDKDVILVDDSIVRGTTSKKIVDMLKGIGVNKIHMRLSCPPYQSPCYYGIDTPTRSELIAHSKSEEEIREHIEADTIHYLSLEGLEKACRVDGQSFCNSCFTDQYPVEPSEDMHKQQILFQRKNSDE